MKKIGVGLIGCGGISSVHFDAIEKLGNVKLIAVADVDAKKAQAKAEKYGCEWTDNWESFACRDDIEAVHICTPHFLHAPMAIKLLQAGKFVLTEKPIATNVDDARQMIASANNKLCVIFQNRYNQSTKFVKNAIETGEFGKLLGLRATVNWHRERPYYTQSGWRGFWATEGGGVMINQAIHTLDLLLHFAGKPLSVKGSVSTDVLGDTIEVEDTAHGVIRFESGVRATYYFTTTNFTDSPV